MAAPLGLPQHQLDPRTFTLQHLATQMNDQGFNVSKHYRRTRWRAWIASRVFWCLFFMRLSAIKKR
ncbi:hypothetical protein SAMN03159488_01660 [Pseudomonas sp. NFIX10]|nr:hypothetical protein SAMN03159488_01660 [Pseudomonas sp. NFIX10]SFF57461.1 hypothetical protein SAMN03159367_05392 [Pseudomonas sp. NFACC06-1]